MAGRSISAVDGTIADCCRALASKTAAEVRAFGSEHSRKMSKMLQSVEDMADELRGWRTEMKDVLSDLQRTAILEWIGGSVDPSRNYNQALKDREKGTGQWFLDSEDFIDWVNTPGLMWIHGIRKFSQMSRVYIRFTRKAMR